MEGMFKDKKSRPKVEENVKKGHMKSDTPTLRKQIGRPNSITWVQQCYIRIYEICESEERCIPTEGESERRTEKRLKEWLYMMQKEKTREH